MHCAYPLSLSLFSQHLCSLTFLAGDCDTSKRFHILIQNDVYLRYFVRKLCFALGSPIPLYMTFTSEDTQALDVLVEPSSIQLLLRRSMATGLEATDDNGPRRSDNHFYENSAIAYFWQSWEAGSSTPNKRVLQGEVEVMKTLKPSFKFPNLCIRVRRPFILR